MTNSFKAQITKEGSDFIIKVNFTEEVELTNAKDYAKNIVENWLSSYPELKEDASFKLRMKDEDHKLTLQ